MCTEIWCFWPLTASTTSEVKNDHAHVITQDICNKFIEINFCVGCMVSQPNRLFQHWTTMSLINKKIIHLLLQPLLTNFTFINSCSQCCFLGLPGRTLIILIFSPVCWRMWHSRKTILVKYGFYGTFVLTKAFFLQRGNTNCCICKGSHLFEFFILPE